MVLLARGDLPRGWEEYEWRLQLAQLKRAFTAPRWRGEAAEGRTVLIHAEQGFGDTLQFCRYVPLVAQRRLRIVLEVQQPWAGNAYAGKPRLALVDRRRSVPPAQLAPIFAVPGVQFFGLQKDGPNACGDLPLIDVMGEMADLPTRPRWSARWTS